MDPILQSLTDAYHDYFSVEHDIVVNCKVLNDPLPSEQTFISSIPEPFLLAGEMGSLNMSALRSLNRIGELADELANYLQQQARKIDLLLHYVLRQQDNAEHRQVTLSYGGAGLCLQSEQHIPPLSVVELKVFLAENEGAIYCLGQVISAEQAGTGWQIKVVFRRIRDQDRELIVRASLHQQSRQLKQKAAQRQLPE
ncbi:PilZ domain-containing protein [Arsukibacterium indicum]|uniref:PilZ domain-containing protein n=1 Tax=Arsukibacterium indicum TaxID=2848612 RepID=A0ABS6MJM3_9GAMM|nr:PilZ domain-containing protein [Arsukibacterium indicum]MBV2128432.1 PilZ domain-containing protein [Arsukibacterium indicum]